LGEVGDAVEVDVHQDLAAAADCEVVGAISVPVADLVAADRIRDDRCGRLVKRGLARGTVEFGARWQRK